jgi:hypothetical protein
MVTPPFKNGALVGDIFSGPSPSISATGLRVIALSIQCFAASESCSAKRASSANGEPFEFSRTPAGWVTSALAPPATRFIENSAYLVSADEGTALFSMPSGPAQEDEWYAREPGGSFLPIGPATPPGITGLRNVSLNVHAPTADLSHLVTEMEVGNPPVVWPFDNSTGEASLYEYGGTANPQPFLVGVTGGPVSTELISTCGTVLGVRGISIWNVLSEDGRTVYFTALHDPQCTGVQPPVNELYARIDGGLESAHTVAISQSECGGGPAPAEEECRKAPPSDAAFQGASADGSRAFFLDTQQLTNEATEGTGTAKVGPRDCVEAENDCNLYLYDLGRPTSENLIDVSAGDASGLGPRVQGVVATAADGSHVYFVAKGVLSSGPNGQGQTAQSAQNNLYVYERDARYPEGHTAFIAPLPASDRDNWNHGYRKANVTPDGRFLVFASHGDLTPDAARTDGAQQIFRYDAQTGELVRIPIGNNGFNDNGNAGAGDATIVPGAGGDLSEQGAGPLRGDPTMSNDGSYVFFQSPVALTPHALNDVVVGHVHEEHREKTEYAQNVYEYHEGHVYLISDGRDVGTPRTPCENRIGEPASNVETFASAACLLGADATGHNVFFTTADQLVPQDTDTQVDIYDARICEPANGNPCIAPEPRQLPPCGGEACHGIPAATPSLLTPGTASFNGEGNLTSPPAAPKVTKKTVKCPKGKKLSHNKCVRNGSRRGKKGKKAKRASNDRRSKA